MYETTQPNFFSINNSNSNFNLNNNNSNNLQNRISLESSLESNKNRSQLTFVCNNDTESNKINDLQYYLIKGNKSQRMKIESPSVKNLNLPLSMNNSNSLTTPKFLVSNTKNYNESTGNSELKNRIDNSIGNNFNTINNKNSTFLNQTINKNKTLSFSNTISSPQNNFLTIPNFVNQIQGKNNSFSNTINFKNQVEPNQINKHNSANKNTSNFIKDDLFNNSKILNKGFLTNIESERNIFMNDGRVKNKKETNYINININIKDEKSDFKKIANIFDSKTKFYLSTSKKDKELNNEFFRTCSLKRSRSKKKISNNDEYFNYKNLPFNGTLTTRKNNGENNFCINTPLSRIKNNKSNSISNYVELTNKCLYLNEQNIWLNNINYLGDDSKKKKNNFPFKNSIINTNLKHDKHCYMTKIVNDSNNPSNEKLKNKKNKIKRMSIDYNTISSIKSYSPIANELKFNKNLKYNKYTNYFNINYNDNKVNFTNTFNNFQIYNPSMKSINSTIKNQHSKNHFMILISIIGEKINKLKRYFLMKFFIFTENVVKTNKKYAIRLLIKIIKRRIICHKLNFFTRSKLFNNNFFIIVFIIFH